MKIKSLPLLAGLLAAMALASHSALAAPAQTQSITLRQGLDNYSGTTNGLLIKGSYQNNNYGANAPLIGGASASERRSLLRFDLSAFANQTVSGDATLTLTQVNTGTAKGSYLIDVYQISAANAGWVQGGGSGAAAVAPESAWAFKNKGAGSDANTLWAGSAGLSTPGIDYVATPIGSITYHTDNNGGTLTVVIPQALMQLWIDDPDSNAGLLFARNSEYDDSLILGGFRQANYTNTNQRPTLTFEVVVPEASTYALFVAVAALGTALVMRRKRRS